MNIYTFYKLSLFVLLSIILHVYAVENYDIQKAYPGGSQVIYKNILYQAKWWAEPHQSPDIVVKNPWETPWQVIKKIDTSIIKEQKPSTSNTNKDKVVTKQHILPKYIFAPFVDATLYPVAKVSEIAQKTGIKYVVLGFIVSKDNKPSWGGYYSLEHGPESWVNGTQYFLYDELKKLRQLGGDFIISFGGAHGTPLAATAKTVKELLEYYQNIVDQFNLTRIDFDIEGQWLSDTSSIERRNKALVELQKRMADKKQKLAIWFTLPVLPTGLTQPGIAVIENALKTGVNLAGINIMAMDYGDSAAPDGKNKMGYYAIEALKSTKTQIQQIYSNFGKQIDDKQAWTMLGVTPMIGQNDILSEQFTLADARQVRDFVIKNNIGLLSMWSLNRDHPCPEEKIVRNHCSSIADQKLSYEYSRIFN